MSHTKRRISPLTIRILAVNVAALLILAAGFLYLGPYQKSLIRSELDALQSEAVLFAGAVSEAAVQNDPSDRPVLVPWLAKPMVRRLGEATPSRIRLFDEQRSLIGDSHRLIGPGGVVQIETLDDDAPHRTLMDSLRQTLHILLDLVPNRIKLAPYPRAIDHDDNKSPWPDARAALNGKKSATAWNHKEEGIMLSAAAPVIKLHGIKGVVLLTRDGASIHKAVQEMRIDIFLIFLGTLLITIILSLYLSRIFARPLKKLSTAALHVRGQKGRTYDIPDLGNRNDEIGDLSLALRDMTHSLWDRMDSIDRFAADVAHEIKNPLTSLRSAIETLGIIKSEDDKKRLMNVIHHDIRRLDRLISDISKASRLDAELSRETHDLIDLKALLEVLNDSYAFQLNKGDIKLDLSLPDTPLQIKGHEDRLAQVFRNLVDNALSFSPEGSSVRMSAQKDGSKVIIMVEDDGPGIPPSKLETIFDRFYTERPQKEGFGSHSGLGLSIVKQIVENHGGTIIAKNNEDEDGQIKGANFTVSLPTA